MIQGKIVKIFSLINMIIIFLHNQSKINELTLIFLKKNHLKIQLHFKTKMISFKKRYLKKR
jgi:hypothetical protein